MNLVLKKCFWLYQETFFKYFLNQEIFLVLMDFFRVFFNGIFPQIAVVREISTVFSGRSPNAEQ